jgi:predicted histidine transporter YuiF (NhaC family)
MYFPLQSYSHYFFRLGKILFKKYILVFNHDDKKIGYYRKDYKKEDKKEENKNEEDKKGDNKFFSQWLFQWIIIGILVIIVGLLSFIIIYYKPWKYRAKRANELQDDDYCYQGINSDGKLNIN